MATDLCQRHSSIILKNKNALNQDGISRIEEKFNIRYEPTTPDH